MATSAQFTIGNKYEFVTYAPALFGVFNTVTIDGIVDHRTAMKYSDVAAMHANVFGSLPAGEVVNDYRKYNYLLMTVNGNQLVLGLPWIVTSSVSELGYRRAIVYIEDVQADQLEKIRIALSSNGFQISSVELE